uniref:Dehydrogenase/reductase SDR family protein 7-like n=1 Tax=Plectus sambesii TaxID=2011161 RepID=A0A914X4Q3_9BILA
MFSADQEAFQRHRLTFHCHPFYNRFPFISRDHIWALIGFIDFGKVFAIDTAMDTLRSTFLDFCEHFSRALIGHSWIRVPIALVTTLLFIVYRIFAWLLAPIQLGQLDVRNKTVLITGASSGVGRALAFRFHRAGAKLILTARSVDSLKQLCAELKAANSTNPNEPVYRHLDMLNPADAAELRHLSPNGQIDILVNNAGQWMRGSCRETALTVHRHIMDVNYFGHVAVTQALIDAIPAGGSVVVVSSAAGRFAVPYGSAYSASKHAIQAYFDALRVEERHLNVLVVSPGYINTNMSYSALTADGALLGKAERNMVNGMSVEYAAEQIYQATVDKRKDVIIAPFEPQFAIFLRYFAPDLGFHLARCNAVIELEKEKREEMNSS